MDLRFSRLEHFKPDVEQKNAAGDLERRDGNSKHLKKVFSEDNKEEDDKKCRDARCPGNDFFGRVIPVADQAQKDRRVCNGIP